MVRAIDWTQYDRLKAEELAYGEIARQWGIPWGPSIGRSRSAGVDRWCIPVYQLLAGGTPEPTQVYQYLTHAVHRGTLNLSPEARNGTPRHTVKKTYVVDTLYMGLTVLYAHAEGVEFKEVVNLAFHKFSKRRGYLPSE
jgi:hypothetical protein